MTEHQRPNAESHKTAMRTWLAAGAFPALLLCLVGATFFTSHAQALEVIDYFGTSSGQGTDGGQFYGASAVAVNHTGAGAADPGEIYVADGDGGAAGRAGRIQRFAYDDNGTPGDPYDDDYRFVSAWGADVVSPGGAGDAGDASDGNFEICTVAAECKGAALTGGGNGTAAGNGALNPAGGVAVDQETGRVYVSDGIAFVPTINGKPLGNNARVTVYEADGTFLFSLGFDVDATTPGTGFEVCLPTDVCKAGVAGGGVGQIGAIKGIAVSAPDGNPSTGKLFVADEVNRRVNTYALDGTGPSSFGSAAQFSSNSPEYVAVDSRGIVYVTDRQNGSEIERYDSENANGGGVGFLTPIPSPPLDPVNTNRKALVVDSDDDGAGPEEDILYSLRDGNSGTTVVQQFGPTNDPGLTVPPASEDAHHGSLVGFRFVGSLGVDPVNERLFVTANHLNVNGSAPVNAPPDKAGVYVLGPAGGLPTASLDSISDVTSDSVELHATVNPNGNPPVSYRVEYSTNGTDWVSGPEAVVGSQTSDQEIDVVLQPPPLGLEPNTFYHVRLAAIKAFTAPVLSGEFTFTTDPEAPGVETAGAPIRSSTSARLSGRVNPRKSPTAYHFEYGDEGACATNPCASTPARQAGTDNEVLLVAEEIAGLSPNTTYHYRLVADNGNPDGPTVGEEMTVRTRASDEPLARSGDYPGPPGSDRAWEMVSLPDSGGNPIGLSDNAISASGNRATYSIAGGTPIAEAGSLFSLYFSQRPQGQHPDSGWQTSLITPPRAGGQGQDWGVAFGARSFSTFLAVNTGSEEKALWRVGPGIAPQFLFQPEPPQRYVLGGSQSLPGEKLVAQAASADLSRVVAALIGGVIDPAYPAASSQLNVYDISDGTPRLLSLMPDGEPSPCGTLTTEVAGGLTNNGNGKGAGAFLIGANESGMVSPDGSVVHFPSRGDDCAGSAQIYRRDMAAGETKLVSGPPLSGALCTGSFLKATDGGVFFATATRLAPDDSEPTGNCQGNDIYRYDLATEGFDCLTCFTPGFPTHVDGTTPETVAVSDDGSRVYFAPTSGTRLLPGAPASAIYRVEVATGGLAVVAPKSGGAVIGSAAPAVDINSDGSLYAFTSNLAALDPLGGASDNGSTAQAYLYDDTDRSLTCVSCPLDGSEPPNSIDAGHDLSEQGTYVFSTAAGLADADQNTGAAPDPDSIGGPWVPATDVYEWRDGRHLLVTDGLTNWTVAPEAQGISSSGSDVLIIASAAYTPDAIDSNRRLYTARIGGGIDFPETERPCPLEVCQGTPEGAPDDPAPASLDLRGAGNPLPEQQGCAGAALRARRLGRTARRYAVRAKRTRRAAAKSSEARRAGRLLGKSRRLSKVARRRAGAAKRMRQRAKRCRASARARANAERGVSR